MSKTSQEKIDQVLEYKAAGFTNKDIAKEMHMSQNTIRSIVGRTKKQVRTKISDADIAKMKELRGKGLSNAQIAHEIGCSSDTVRRYIFNQPDMNRSAYGSIIAHVTGETYLKEKKEPEAKPKKLKTVKTEISMEGDICSYKVSSEGRARITFSTGTAVDFTANDFFKLISELCEVGEWLSQNTTESKPAYKQRMDGTYISQ